MARPLRIEFDRAFYHVTSRGNAREPVFITDINRVLFIDKKPASIARLKTPLAPAVPEIAKPCLTDLSIEPHGPSNVHPGPNVARCVLIRAYR